MQGMRLALVGMAAGMVGCVEHWYAHDAADLEVAVEGEALVDAHVTTAPSAWPEDGVYDQALRVAMFGEQVAFVGEVVGGDVIDRDYQIDDWWGDNVNVLDAWQGCDPRVTCARTLRFRVRCAEAEGCVGVVSADAFLATEESPHTALPGFEAAGGGLELSLSLATPARR